MYPDVLFAVETFPWDQAMENREEHHVLWLTSVMSAWAEVLGDKMRKLLCKLILELKKQERRQEGTN